MNIYGGNTNDFQWKQHGVIAQRLRLHTEKTYTTLLQLSEFAIKMPMKVRDHNLTSNS